MAYTPPNTYAAGAFDSALVDENLTALRAYTQNGIVAGDYDTDWVIPRHIRQGRYDGITQMHTFESGLCADRQHTPDTPPTFLVMAVTDKLLSGSAALYVEIPNTARDFYLHQSAAVVVQCIVHPVVVDATVAATAMTGWIQLELDGALVGAPKALHREETTTVSKNARQPIRLFWGGTLAAGHHTIRLVGATQAAIVSIRYWSVTVEAYYFTGA